MGRTPDGPVSLGPAGLGLDRQGGSSGPGAGGGLGVVLLGQARSPCVITVGVDGLDQMGCPQRWASCQRPHPILCVKHVFLSR